MKLQIAIIVLAHVKRECNYGEGIEGKRGKMPRLRH